MQQQYRKIQHAFFWGINFTTAKLFVLRFVHFLLPDLLMKMSVCVFINPNYNKSLYIHDSLVL